jgi:hypothetical protein
LEYVHERSLIEKIRLKRDLGESLKERKFETSKRNKGFVREKKWRRNLHGKPYIHNNLVKCSPINSSYFEYRASFR